MVPKLTNTRAKCPRLAYFNKAYDLIFSQLQQSLVRLSIRLFLYVHVMITAQTQLAFNVSDV